MRILGISAFYHDSAAALLENGCIVAAAQEERFSRIKNDSTFPRRAIDYCLQEAGLSIGDVDEIVFYDKPFLKFERLLETYLAFAPKGFRSFRMAIPLWLREKLFQKNLLLRELKTLEPQVYWPSRLLFSEHHVSHAASAFFASPFQDAAVLTMDGVGEWATTSLSIGRGHHLEVIKEIHFPHSLGLLYSAFTALCGFKVNSGEYKLMGLAPYGTPRFAKTILDHCIDVKDDGSFRLDMQYFDYCIGLMMISARLENLFGMQPRQPNEALTQAHMDMAASIQTVLEQVVLKLTRSAAKETGMENLCLAGGVALNCVANGKILKDGAFRRLWVQPAAGDAGGALGAALAAYYLHKGQPRTVAPHDAMQGSYLGPAFLQQDIEARLTAAGASFNVLPDEKTLVAHTADALAAGKAVGWFQGRMEFGPRALGNRSILADPRNPAMQKDLNLKVKFRESFRPFAPSILSEHATAWFDLPQASPYMQIVADVLPKHRLPASPGQDALFGLDKRNVARSDIPAVTHVDYSARVQTVHTETNPLYHALITAFHERTGCPLLLNTSFNVRGEPIVCSPEDAFRCFMGNDIDILVMGRCWLRKEDQDGALRQNYRHSFAPD